jgi:hypothetical protein
MAERRRWKYVSIRFKEELLDQIRELAEGENRSINGTVVEAVERYLRSRRRQPKEDT